jgi:DNA transformation protein and related proteins
MKRNSLSGRINIGKDTEAKLIQAGIDSFEKLEAMGSERAFLLLQAMDPGACLNLLYGLEGAITGIKWHDLSPEKKQELLLFHKMARENVRKGIRDQGLGNQNFTR